ncbi:MAG: ChbG/HpnK family deacetylase [Puniceicoccaceae bacterium]|nr:MAG: ChbG/HpnK family deacetylase [Puniceicoccaceae bacterium]
MGERTFCAMIELLTRADDAGSSRSANRAIREACLDGICRNLGLMAPAPAIDDAAVVLRDLPGVDIGVHATVTSEWEAPRWGPLLGDQSHPGLRLEDGCFPQTTQALREREVPPEAILAEVKAQIAKIRSLGFDPSYLDEHMGFGWLPGLEAALAELARKEGLVYRRDLDGLPRSEAPVGAESGRPENFLRSLEAARPGLYLVVAHPCYDDEETRGIVNPSHQPGFHGPDRDGQRRMYTDPRVRDWVNDPSNNVRLVRYRELAGR